MKYVKLYEEMKFNGRNIRTDINHIIDSVPAIRKSIEKIIKKHVDVGYYIIDKSSSLCDYDKNHHDYYYTNNLENEKELLINYSKIQNGEYLNASIRIEVGLSKKSNESNHDFHTKIIKCLLDLMKVKGLSQETLPRCKEVFKSKSYDKFGGFVFAVYYKVDNIFKMSERGVLKINK